MANDLQKRSDDVLSGLAWLLALLIVGAMLALSALALRWEARHDVFTQQP